MSCDAVLLLLLLKLLISFQFKIYDIKLFGGICCNFGQ